VLRAMMWMPTLSDADFSNEKSLQAWCEQLEQRLLLLNGTGPRYRVVLQQLPDRDNLTIEIVRQHHGTARTRTLQRGFFRSPEYQRIAAIGANLKDLIEPGGYATRGDARKEVASFPEAVDWLMEQAKQGQSIQRYKGLGEMNPEQLWETTVNPETRRLMQVKIEDAVAADEIFTTLMGDQVEPRREFIEHNALAASNIDV
jgi:DNA gyrase subunit B